MRIKQKLSGFTLVELLVAMAIIAILIGLAIGAITIAQRASRDAQRRSAVQEVTALLESYYGTYSQYPTAAAANCTGQGASGQVCRRANGIWVAGTVVDLTGALRPLPRPADPDSASSTGSGTYYCYVHPAGARDGYVVGVLQEDGVRFTELSNNTIGNNDAHCRNTFLL